MRWPSAGMLSFSLIDANASVDLETGIDCDSMPIAIDALVLMVVVWDTSSLTVWMVKRKPIKSMSVFIGFRRLEWRQSHPHVMDPHEHIAVLESHYPDVQVYVILHVCYMLKLMPNTLADHGCCSCADGQGTRVMLRVLWWLVFYV